MINPELPMYDSEGREWVALRMPDGSVYVDYDGDITVVHGKTRVHMQCANECLTNTKPPKDCEIRLHTALDECTVVQVLVRRRNGVITAEVVNDE